MNLEEIADKLEELENNVQKAQQDASSAKMWAHLALETLKELAEAYPEDTRMQKAVKDLEFHGI